MEGSDHSPSNDAALRAARNQSLFRGINEKIDEVNDSFKLLIDDGDYVCECANDQCLDRVVMSRDDYLAVRRISTHFFVRRQHVYPEFERIVQERDGFVVVEKYGEAGAEAVALARETMEDRASGAAA